MQLNFNLELTMELDSERFYKLLKKFLGAEEYETPPDYGKYTDSSLVEKGLFIMYFNEQYRKKIKIIVNSDLILKDEEPNKDNAFDVVRKLEKRIEKYFKSKFRLNHFKLTGVIITKDIDVSSRDTVSDYIQVLRRIGRVKGFSPAKDNEYDDNLGFRLKGISNNIEFVIFDLERVVKELLEDEDSKRKHLKSELKNSKGKLRIELRLTKPKTVKNLTKQDLTYGQVGSLFQKGEKIFENILSKIIPFGHFYKKDEAVQLIWNEVKDKPIRRRMLYLLDLIPEKKSLHLAQKKMNSRRMDDIMEKFEEIELSPITISKRHDVKYLENLYSYF